MLQQILGVPNKLGTWIGHFFKKCSESWETRRHDTKKKISTKREKKTNIALFFYCRVKERTYFWNWQNYHTRQKEKKKTTLIDVRLIKRSQGIYRSKTILTPVASKSDIISTDHILSVTKISIYSLVEKKKS